MPSLWHPKNSLRRPRPPRRLPPFGPNFRRAKPWFQRRMPHPQRRMPYPQRRMPFPHRRKRFLPMRSPVSIGGQIFPNCGNGFRIGGHAFLNCGNGFRIGGNGFRIGGNGTGRGKNDVGKGKTSKNTGFCRYQGGQWAKRDSFSALAAEARRAGIVVESATKTNQAPSGATSAGGAGKMPPRRG